MTGGEIREYLESRHRIILVTNGADAMPHPVPMEYGLDDHGHIFVTSFRKSQKIRNLERDPRATLLVESGERYHELKGVMLYCNAEIISESEQVRQLMGLLRASDSLAASMSDTMNAQVQDSLRKRVIVRLMPYHLISWDHGKLADTY